ncbi:hypothetical protein M0804_012617 [Polistes exclamans]|nr:hypothetical protein M0804_012617 [Polistes exclamans]
MNNIKHDVNRYPIGDIICMNKQPDHIQNTMNMSERYRTMIEEVGKSLKNILRGPGGVGVGVRSRSKRYWHEPATPYIDKDTYRRHLQTSLPYVCLRVGVKR